MIKVSSSRKPTVEQLLGLYQHAWWTKMRTASGVRKMLKHTGLVLTAWEGRQLVGFARVITDFTYRAIIADVIVHPGQHGLGIGKTLVQAALKHPKLQGVGGFWLYTTDKQAFYKKLGFQLSPDNLMIYRTAKAPVPPRKRAA